MTLAIHDRTDFHLTNLQHDALNDAVGDKVKKSKKVRATGCKSVDKVSTKG